MSGISLGGHQIANWGRPFIIAEAGINHNGSLDLAFQMVRAAKEAGADCIKFQTFKADEFVGDPNQTYTYRSQGGEVTESMLEMFRRYEFSREGWLAVKEECDRCGILFLSTPQNYSDLKLLLELGVSAVKVGSDDFTNIPLLKSYAAHGLPLLLSCGMATLSEVYESLETVGALDGRPTVLFLCTSQYPTPPADVNLLKLKTLHASFPELTLGFSDHTQGVRAACAAVALGAVVFEKHFTMDHGLPGPDHWFSEDPEGLAAWVSEIRLAHTMLGSAVVRPTAKEREMRVLARRSVVAIRDVAAGEPFTAANIALKRPGNGIPASLFEQILTTRAARDIAAGQLLQWGDFA